MKKVFLFLFIGIMTCTKSIAQEADGKSTALETMGVLSTVAIYNTYLAIGSIADGYGTTYDSDYALTLMNEQVGLLSQTAAQLDTLATTNFLDEADKAFVSGVSECVNYLKMQAQAMAVYAKSDSQADLDSYHFYRERAWAMIENLLGLKED